MTASEPAVQDFFQGAVYNSSGERLIQGSSYPPLDYEVMVGVAVNTFAALGRTLTAEMFEGSFVKIDGKGVGHFELDMNDLNPTSDETKVVLEALSREYLRANPNGAIIEN
jgi:hypothetical protein